MIIYHGSTIPVEFPKIMLSERKLDFGEGFYTTYNREQAVRWSVRVQARRKTDTQVISEYEFDLETAKKDLRIIQFDEPDEKWLDFVSLNRSGRIISKPYDIAIGPVADDDVYGTVLLYEQGFLDKESAIKRFKVRPLFNQILFHTEISLKYFRYIRHETIGGSI